MGFVSPAAVMRLQLCPGADWMGTGHRHAGDAEACLVDITGSVALMPALIGSSRRRACRAPDDQLGAHRRDLRR